MRTTPRIVLLDRDRDACALTREALGQELGGARIDEVTDARGLARALEAGDFDLVITEHELGWATGLGVLHAVKMRHPDRPVLMFTATARADVAVEAMKAGLDDYVVKGGDQHARLGAAVRAVLDPAWAAGRPAAGRVGFLAEAGVLLGGERDYEAIVASVVRLACPALADHCTVSALDANGEIRVVAAAHRDPTKDRILQQMRLARAGLDLQSDFPVARVLRTGLPEFLPEIPDTVALALPDPEHRRLMGALAPRSALILPLVANRRTLGALALVSDAGARELGATEIGLARELAVLASLALENARLHHEVQATSRAHADSLAQLEQSATHVARLADAEAALGARARQFEAAVEHSPDLIARLDRRLRLLYANPAVGQAFGVPVSECVGRTRAEIGLPRTVWGPWEEGCRAAFETGDEQRVELNLRLPSGDVRHYQSRMAPELGPDGVVVSVLAIATDVTERRHAEEERARLLVREQAARREAEAASRAKDEFLAMLSHELRTPLSAILLSTGLLRSGRLDDVKTARVIDGIERSARTQAQLIDDLLDVSRIITGKLRMEVRTLRLSEPIQAAVETIRPAAEVKGLDLRTSFDPTVDPLAGDPARLQQVVWNLLSNAVKFTPAGGSVTLSLTRVGDEAEITVADTGAGILADAIPHVFDRFWQGDGTARPKGGIGLGLAIVRELVGLHGGTVRAESGGRNAGATFTVRLPLLSPARAAPQPSVRLPEPTEEPDLQGVRVLVVDDDDDARTLLTLVLEQRGAQVTAATSAAEALAAVHAGQPDVLVADLAMPEVDGFMLIRQIRALGSDRGGGTPAIALTALAGYEEARQAITAGYQLHLPKPFDPADVTRSIALLVSHDRRAAAEHPRALPGDSGRPERR